MKLPLLLALAAGVFAAPPAAAQSAPSPTTQKICGFGDGRSVTVGYSSSCPTGSKVTAKLCPSGVQVAYASPCPARAPAPAAGSVRKLCADGSIVAYSATCASAGTVRKLCVNGAVVAYSSPCPATLPALAVGGRAIALQGCRSAMNPADLVAIGAAYKIEGFAGWTTPGVPPASRDLVVLSNATRHGDGWFAYWVPIGCVVPA
jgi:hypothetical protein